MKIRLQTSVTNIQMGFFCKPLEKWRGKKIWDKQFYLPINFSNAKKSRQRDILWYTETHPKWTQTISETEYHQVSNLGCSQESALKWTVVPWNRYKLSGGFLMLFCSGKFTISLKFWPCWSCQEKSNWTQGQTLKQI